MYYHRGSIKLTHNDETGKNAHGSQIAIAKENLKLSHGGPATDKYQEPTHWLMLYLEPLLSLRLCNELALMSNYTKKVIIQGNHATNPSTMISFHQFL